MGERFGDGTPWWAGEPEWQTPNQLWHNWPAIQRHPRFVVDELDDLMVMVILRYLDAGQPFTVVRP